MHVYKGGSSSWQFFFIYYFFLDPFIGTYIWDAVPTDLLCHEFCVLAPKQQTVNLILDPLVGLVLANSFCIKLIQLQRT